MAEFGNYWKGFYFTWWSTYLELSILTIGLFILLVLLIYSAQKLYCITHARSLSALRASSRSPSIASLSPTAGNSSVSTVSNRSNRSNRSNTRNDPTVEIIRNMNWRYKLLLLSSLVWSVLQVSYSVILLVCIAMFDIQIPCGARSSNILPVALQRLSMYAYFMLRMHDTFENSVFAIKHSFLVLFVVCVLCIMLVMVGWYIFEAFHYSSGGGFDCKYERIFLPITMLIVIDLCTNLFLGVLFVYKLNEVAVANTPEPTQEDPIQNNESFEVFRHLVRKLLVLLVCNVVISALSLSLIFALFTYGSVCVDLVVSNVCLCLCFQFNEKYYEKLCKCCIYK